jgi:hypothetical protein
MEQPGVFRRQGAQALRTSGTVEGHDRYGSLLPRIDATAELRNQLIMVGYSM